MFRYGALLGSVFSFASRLKQKQHGVNKAARTSTLRCEDVWKDIGPDRKAQSRLRPRSGATTEKDKRDNQVCICLNANVLSCVLGALFMKYAYPQCTLVLSQTA